MADSPSDPWLPVVDLAVGLGVVAARAPAAAVRLAGRAATAGQPLVRAAGRLLPEAHRPDTLLRLADSGARQRAAIGSAVSSRVRALVPRVLDLVLDEVDLTGLVVDRVDLDAVVAHVDVDAVVARADLAPIVARVPMDDVLGRVDLIGLAEYVIDGVDLPEIIRDSTGSMASEGIRGVRLQTIEADERVNRLVDRVLFRRQSRRTQAPEPVETVADDQASARDGSRGNGEVR